MAVSTGALVFMLQERHDAALNGRALRQVLHAWKARGMSLLRKVCGHVYKADLDRATRTAESAETVFMSSVGLG